MLCMHMCRYPGRCPCFLALLHTKLPLTHVCQAHQASGICILLGHTYTPYMTVYLEIYLPNILCIYTMVLANPFFNQRGVPLTLIAKRSRFLANFLVAIIYTSIFFTALSELNRICQLVKSFCTFYEHTQVRRASKKLFARGTYTNKLNAQQHFGGGTYTNKLNAQQHSSKSYLSTLFCALYNTHR